MSTETNTTWFDGAHSEYVRTDTTPQPENEFATPLTDALPRTPHGLGYLEPWFDEQAGHVRWNRNDG